MKRLLITFYTKTNTTKDYCNYIKDNFNLKDWSIDITPIHQVAEIRSYDGVIIGGPINGMNWVTEASEFVETYKEELADKKVGLFFTAYLINNSRQFWQNALEKSLKKYDSTLHPIAYGYFGGKIDKPFGGIPRLIFGNRKEEPLDRTNFATADLFISDYKSKL